MNEFIFQPPTEATAVDTAPLKKDMRRSYSRCGWALLAASVFMILCSLALGAAIKYMNDGAVGFIQNNLLILNEALIVLCVAAGMLVLIGTKVSAPERAPVSAKFFLMLLCICFTVGTVGNLIGSLFLIVWNTVTGSGVTNQLTEVLTNTSPWQMFLCTGLLAPVIEEFFFRKVLIDRMYRHGELAAILTSAVFFGLFHQNFSQLFYAFGLGVILAYLYCKTRSYLAVTLLHVAFNTIMGVIPALLMTPVMEYAQALETASEAEMMTILAEYIGPMMLYLLYLLAVGILNIAGAILLIVNFKKISINKNNPALTPAEKRRSAILNPGTIAAGIILTLLMMLSLFTS